MVVTEDGQSDYSSTPNLRIFGQHSDLHQPPSRELLQSGQATPSQLRDPVAGQVKISRTGRPLYVRPAHELDGEVDLSREENNGGLFAATRTPTLGLSYSAGADGRQSPHISWQGNSRIKRNDGERARRHKDVKAARLHTERGFTFWRWNIEIELGSTQHRVAYRINKGPAIGFWVPARGETMHIMFHSCNGFSLAVDPSQFSGPDPLWRNVLNRHQSRPFHVMLGGGDQIYNDAAMRDTELFKDWLQTKNPHEKHGAEFSPEMQDELESFYLHRYAMWFSQGMFAMAGAQIPMVNVWDDHDIIDGFGSYPHHFMSTKVFTGLGAVAFKYYMLFQHQSVVSETTKEEPSWVLGAGPGPYINELSRNIFLNLGRKVAFLGVDCRTERMRDEILSEQSYDILFERCQDEIVKGEVKHLIVLLGVPIAYPRLNFLENILTSRVMDPIKAIGRTGMLGGFVNKFDGGVEILDDLDDHWTAKHHKEERNWFIQELQELAASKSVRVTILGGDVHLGAVGQFYTPKKVGVQKDRDHRYMPNVVSSAIVNTPPPPMMADVLNKRNKVHHLDDETDEDLIPMFEADVDGSKRNNKCLLPRRNYCTIRAFEPGHTPPPTPPPERQSFDQGGERGFEAQGDNRDRRYPPGSMKRTMSLTRGPGSLIRRLSGGGRNKNPPVSLLQEHTRNYNDYGQDGSPAFGTGRSNSLSGPRPESAGTARRASGRPDFMRRPTTLNEKEIKKALAKGGAPDENGEADAAMIGQINLEGGLDICLNMEIDQRDPGGSTMPYRMLVPGLWYEGPGDPNTLSLPKRQKEGGFLQRFKSQRRKIVGSQASSAGSSRSGSPDGRQQQGGAMAPAAGPVLNRAATAPQGTNKLQKQDYGNDGAEDSPRNGSSGRGGFLQRFRSQRRRSMSSERSYSRSPSPEPQQQQQQYPGPEPQSPSAIPGIGGPRKLQKNNDYAPPNGGTDRSRSGGFLQRFRSRRNRSPESYSGSSARSASPEPQQQQAPVAAQGGPGWVPTATGGVRMPIAERRSMDQGQSNARSAAYDRGMQGSGPPVGGDRRAQSMSLGSRGMGTRFYSAGGGRDDWREGDGVEDEFFDPGEEGRGVPPQRQGSKAERMLGMYDGAGEGQGEMTEGRGGKKKWMAWR